MVTLTRAYLPEEMDYVAKRFNDLLIPVTLCMLVVLVNTSITFYTKTNTDYVYIPFTYQTVDTLPKVWQSFANLFFLMGLIVCMNILSVFLYKFGYYKVIRGLLILSSSMQLFFLAYYFLGAILRACNITMDYITVSIMIWNFVVVGIVCIYWKGPLILQNVYHMLNLTLFALVLITNLPNWTALVALGVISLWDLISVLCPKGPLRIFNETAQERNEPIFSASIYSPCPSNQNSLPDGLPFHHQDMSSEYEDYQQAMAQHAVNSTNSLSLHSAMGEMASLPTALNLPINNQDSLPDGLPFHHQDMSSEYEDYQQAMAQHAVNSTNSLSLHSAMGEMASLPTALNLPINNQDNYSSCLGSSLGNREIPKIYKPAREFYKPKLPDTLFIFMDRFRKEMAEKDLEGGMAAVSKLEPGEAEYLVSPILLPHPRSSDRSSRKKRRVTGSAYSPYFQRLNIYIYHEESLKFICYNVLVGKAAFLETKVACLVAIFFGEGLTTLLLAFFKKVPVLTIPITFGLISYFTTSSLL
ncbi:hypothetical protein JTE90_017331 [Oedothorax gibbosus]|uniref:Presenilin n=1 Tax=Oedothorax gibbosus TaxID=931172 RepID=A0AAV6UC12_9ARAC|nr:hypothetical protein JTE90_017331 [Oedothorax gibbosus]